jgi:polar amino acid transport system substrate-binding protein
MRPHPPFFLTLGFSVLAAASPLGSGQAPKQSGVPPFGQTLTQTTELRMVSTPWAPFTNMPGQPRFALDLVEAGLGRVGVGSNTTIVEPVRFGEALLSDQFDGSGAAWKNEARERVLLYSQPYLENRLILVGRKGADVSAPVLQAVHSSKKVGIVEGFAYGDLDHMGPTFVKTHSDQDSVARLMDSQLDYVLIDEFVLKYIVDHYEKQARDKLAIGTVPLLKRPLHLVVRRTLPDAEAIITRFNAQLRGMIVDHTYHRLLHVDWIRADVDGDGIEEYIPKDDDQAGTLPPKNAYSLFSDRPTGHPSVPDKYYTPGVYVGGTIYPDWVQVPAKYKTPASPVKPEEQDPDRSTASLFKWVWK